MSTPDPRDAEIARLKGEVAEQTARAERAEADRAYAYRCNEAMREPMAALRAAVGMPAEGEGAVVAAVLSERAAALAACAEMRAALRRLCIDANRMSERPRQGTYDDDLHASVANARDILARPDLGRGVVVVVTGSLDALVDNLVRVVCDCHDNSDLWAHTRRDPEAFRRAVRGALLKRGG